ncbi:MAG TPA: putative zinc-binding protein [Syntrophorhabdaceae bacterium]|jgi:uncharacterized metal-binding protein
MMNSENLCGVEGKTDGTTTYETVRIEKTKNVCPMCEDYSRANGTKPIVVMSCEGACLRGEVARRAANLLCHELIPEKTARLCLGGAFTKDTGQRGLARNGAKVVALEGCFIECASRMMKGVIPELAPEVIIADRLYDFDRSLFGINDMAEEEIKAHALTVAMKVREGL